MTGSRDLETLEQRAYQSSFSDGIIDVFVGVSLAWIGFAWIWLPDLAGIAGVFPAVFVTSMLALRKRTVESRGGYVKWSAPRRKWERRNYAAILTAGVALLLVGVATFIVVDQSSGDNDVVGLLMPGLLAWLLALVAIGLGFLMATWRLFAYAGVLAVAGVVTVWAAAGPGWPILGSGIVVAAIGITLLARFLRDNPVIETS